jgi:hypothetical protein
VVPPRHLARRPPLRVLPGAHLAAHPAAHPAVHPAVLLLLRHPQPARRLLRPGPSPKPSLRRCRARTPAWLPWAAPASAARDGPARPLPEAARLVLDYLMTDFS